MKKLIKTDVLLTPLHINTLLYNLLVGSDLGSNLGLWDKLQEQIPLRHEVPAFCRDLAQSSLLSMALDGFYKVFHSFPSEDLKPANCLVNQAMGIISLVSRAILIFSDSEESFRIAR